MTEGISRRKLLEEAMILGTGAVAASVLSLLPDEGHAESNEMDEIRNEIKKIDACLPNGCSSSIIGAEADDIKIEFLVKHAFSVISQRQDAKSKEATRKLKELIALKEYWDNKWESFKKIISEVE